MLRRNNTEIAGIRRSVRVRRGPAEVWVGRVHRYGVGGRVGLREWGAGAGLRRWIEICAVSDLVGGSASGAYEVLEARSHW